MKIKGIQFKAIKTYIGHEGETCIYGNVYYQGKKVGEIKEETWSGSLGFTPNEIGRKFSEEMKKQAVAFLQEYPNGWLNDKPMLGELYKDKPLDAIFSQLHSIYFIEKAAKNMFRENYPLYVIVKKIDHWNARTYSYGCHEESLPKILQEYPYLVAKLTKDSFMVE